MSKMRTVAACGEASWRDVNAMLAPTEPVLGALVCIANDGFGALLTFDGEIAPPENPIRLVPAPADDAIVTGTIIICGMRVEAAAVRR